MADLTNDLQGDPSTAHGAGIRGWLNGLRGALAGGILPIGADGRYAETARDPQTGDLIPQPNLGAAGREWGDVHAHRLIVGGEVVNLRDISNFSPVILTRDSAGQGITRAGDVPADGLHTYDYEWQGETLTRAEIIVASPQTGGGSARGNILYRRSEYPFFNDNRDPRDGAPFGQRQRDDNTPITREQAADFMDAGDHGLYYIRRGLVTDLTRGETLRLTFGKGGAGAEGYAALLVPAFSGIDALGPQADSRPAPSLVVPEDENFTCAAFKGMSVFAAHGAARVASRASYEHNSMPTSRLQETHRHSATFTPSSTGGSDNQPTTTPASVSIGAAGVALNETAEVNAVRGVVMLNGVAYGRGGQAGQVFSEFAGDTEATATPEVSHRNGTRGHDGFVIIRPIE